MTGIKVISFLFLSLFMLIGSDAQSVLAGEHNYSAVYLDPHYGGRENGPRVDSKNKGKDVTLAIAKAIQRELSNNNITTYLSREDDVYIPRGDRWFFAKKRGADIYLSLRLILQDRDCVRLYYGKRRPADLMSTKTHDLEGDVPIDAGEDRTQESIRLSELLSKSLKQSEQSLCSAVQTKKDVLFETADFPAVIVEFGMAREKRLHSYVVDPAKIDLIAKSFAIAIKEFIEMPQN